MQTKNIDGKEYTFPQSTVGKNIKKADHGPFYLYSAGMNIHRVDMHDSVPHIYAGRVTPCTDWVVRLPEYQAAADCIVMRDVSRNAVGETEEFAYNILPADAIKNSILVDEAGHENVSYGPLGVIEVLSFRHRSPVEIKLDLFNSIVRPSIIEPGERTILLGADMRKRIEEEGGLAVRQKFVEDALKRVESNEFIGEFGEDLSNLYLRAIAELLKSFSIAMFYATNQLTAADNEVQRSANGDSEAKRTYSLRDRYLQWLLARKPINEALATIAAKQNQQVVVNVPAQPAAPGITRDDIIAIVQAVMQANQLQQQAQAFVQPVAPDASVFAPLTPEVVAEKVEELVLPKPEAKVEPKARK